MLKKSTDRAGSAVPIRTASNASWGYYIQMSLKKPHGSSAMQRRRHRQRQRDPAVRNRDHDP